MTVRTAVLAVDPGGAHVGLAGWNEGEGRVSTEISADAAVGAVKNALIGYKLVADRVVLVLEEFRLYGHKAQAQSWSTMDTSEMIGALKYVASELGVEVVEQGAGIKKPTARQLRARGIDREGVGGHARDAELHLLHYCLKEGLCRNAKSL